MSGDYCYGYVSSSSCPGSYSINTSSGTNGHLYSCSSGHTLSGSTCSYTP